MPPTQEAIDKAIEKLSQLKLEEFTANPDRVRPFGDAILSWRISGPTDLEITLNGRIVPMQGSQVVQPEVTAAHTLVGQKSTMRQILGQRTITVEAEDCFAITVTEAEVRTNIQNSIHDEYGDDGKDVEKFGINFTLTLTRPAKIEVDATGVSIKIALNVGIPNFWDATLDVDALVILTAQGGRAKAIFRHFNSDFDLPIEAYIAGGALAGLGGVGITKIIEELMDSEVGPTVRTNVSEKIQETLDQHTALLRLTHPGSRLFTLTTAQNRVIAMLCPFTPDIG
jgi:hypothetical protein